MQQGLESGRGCGQGVARDSPAVLVTRARTPRSPSTKVPLSYVRNHKFKAPALQGSEWEQYLEAGHVGGSSFKIKNRRMGRGDLDSGTLGRKVCTAHRDPTRRTIYRPGEREHQEKLLVILSDLESMVGLKHGGLAERLVGSVLAAGALRHPRQPFIGF